jgi:hypothetical protein
MTYRTASAAPLLLFLLAACSAGGGTSGSVPLTQAPSSAQTEAQSDAQNEAVWLPLSGANDLLYIGNAGNNSITVYNHAAAGNTPPLAVIAGSKTGLAAPGQLSEDARGNLYVTNGASFFGRAADPSILVFAHGAHGNVAPIRKITGASGFTSIEAMIVDKGTGKIFVAANGVGAGDASTLMRFPPNAAGREAPFASGSFSYWALQLAADSSGKHLIMVHEPICCFAGSGGTETFVKQFANDAALSNLYLITGITPQGVADDPTSKTYLVTSNIGIYRLAENTVSVGALDLKPAPVSLITSDTCASQVAVAPGPTPYTYVTHNTAAAAFREACAADAVYVYANSASGNAAPVRVLSGPATKLNLPYGIYEGF